MTERNVKGQFIKGHKCIPLTEDGLKKISEKSTGNQYAKGNKPNKTSFKNGQVSPNKGKNMVHSGSFKKGHKFIVGGERGWFKKGHKLNWQGGLSFEPYTTDWTKTLRQSIRERDKYTCKICGEKQGYRALSVHHIDYDKENCNPDNLISLCLSCHMKTNFNRNYWIDYFSNLF